MSAYLKRLYIDSIEESAEQPSAYLKRVDIVEVVDADGNPWEPVPGPDPWDELVKDVSPVITTSAPLAPGTTINGTTGTFVGGDANNTYRWRWRYRPTGGNWTNEAWTTGVANEVIPVTFDLPADTYNYQVQLQSQGRNDEQDPAVSVISNSPTKNTENRTFGDISVTVNGIEYDSSVAPALTILMNDPIPVVVSIAGNAEPTYTWTARNDYPVVISTQARSTILTCPEAGGATVTCTLSDPSTAEGTTSIIINFFVVDAFE